MKGKLKSCLSCIPEVVSFDINPLADEFILLSTDGIFDVLSMKQIVIFTLRRWITFWRGPPIWKKTKTLIK